MGLRHKTNGGKPVYGQKKEEGKQTTERCLIRYESEILAHNWITLGNERTRKQEDYSSTKVLDWWKRNEGVHPDIANSTRRR